MCTCTMCIVYRRPRLYIHVSSTVNNWVTRGQGEGGGGGVLCLQGGVWS